MAWSAPATRTTGTLITAAIWNQDVVANPQALYDNSFAQAAYDSGWFAAARNSSIIKSHGLSAAPVLFMGLFATTASPTSYYVWYAVAYDGYGSPTTANSPRITIDATNIGVVLPPWVYSGYNGSGNLRTDYSSGYLRFLAWAI